MKKNKKKKLHRTPALLHHIRRAGSGAGYHTSKKYSRKVKHKREFE